jgi:hypothetical protein
MLQIPDVYINVAKAPVLVVLLSAAVASAECCSEHVTTGACGCCDILHQTCNDGCFCLGANPKTCLRCRHHRYGNESARAGHPERVAKYAIPSDNKHYIGFYMGGSTPFARHGDPRFLDEGTWGWDYWGHWLKRRVALYWWHGRNSQRAFGSYATDGPKIFESK